jgi:hypothetical protein
MKGRKVFDWLLRFGIMASVILGMAGGAISQEDPDGKRRSDQSKVVAERDDGAEETDDEEEFVIEVKIPKPEALIFSRRMDMKYKAIGYEKSFTDKIIDSAKQSPF